MQAQTIMAAIQAQLGPEQVLRLAPQRPSLLDGLMASAGHPKVALEGGQVVGLNLEGAGIDDATWSQIVKVLEEGQVRLRALNLYGNRLSHFIPPPGIAVLERLDLEDNPLVYPNPQILELGNAAVLNFLKQGEEQEGTVPLHEAKLLIVGEPGAGKSTLQRKLADPAYLVPPEGDKALESTVGVNILEGWEFPFVRDPSFTFKANLWDFGGQDIQYMTHHFFLTPRALYVLVADDRKQNTEFEYWFRIIDLLGREKEGEMISVLVVLNGKRHVAATNFDPGKYRRDYPDLDMQVWEVDFSKKDDRSDGLARKVQGLLCDLPHIGDPLPRLWIPIREDLLVLRKESPHISFDEFARICSRERGGKRMEREEDQRILSGYLHRLGVLLHYQDDDKLDNFVILNPQWAVDAVYSVMKDDRVFKNNGRFTAADLRDCWKGYSSDERARLLSLMLKDKFEICYPSPRPGEYIAPQLLPSRQPAYDWDSTGAMKFRFQYPFMPKGLISRLIVRLSEDIAGGGGLVWKEGMVVERNDCQAQVIQKKTVKEGLEVLDIEILGPARERKALLSHIREEVKRLHKHSFRLINFEEMIPCTCEVCRGSESPNFFEYSTLQQYEQEKYDTIDCRNGRIKRVSVRGLLDGVFEVSPGAVRSRVQRLLAEGELAAALDCIYAEFPDDHVVIQLHGKWKSLQQGRDSGLIDHNQFELGKAEIRQALLNFIDGLAGR